MSFNSPVTVNLSGGTPTLLLNAGNGATATYVSGSGTSTLTFDYTVGASQQSYDLDYTSTAALQINGGTIEDSQSNAAILTLPATGTDGLRIKNIIINTANVVSGYSVAIASSGNLTIFDATSTGETDELSVSYNGTIYTFGDPNNTFTLVSALAGASVSQDGHTLTVNKAQATSFTGSSIVLDLQAETVTVSLTASAGHPLDRQLDLQGGAGTNALRVDLPTGTSLPAAGIQFGDDTGSTDMLEISAAGQLETLSATGATADSGTISDSTGTLTFTNVQSADLHGLGATTVATHSGNAPVELIDGFDLTLGGTTPALEVEPTGSGSAFTTVALWNNSAVEIDTTADSGNGAVTVASADNASNNLELDIRTAGAADTISIPGNISVSAAVVLFATGSSITESRRRRDQHG